MRTICVIWVMAGLLTAQDWRRDDTPRRMRAWLGVPRETSAPEDGGVTPTDSLPVSLPDTQVGETEGAASRDVWFPLLVAGVLIPFLLAAVVWLLRRPRGAARAEQPREPKANARAWLEEAEARRREGRMIEALRAYGRASVISLYARSLIPSEDASTDGQVSGALSDRPESAPYAQIVAVSSPVLYGERALFPADLDQVAAAVAHLLAMEAAASPTLEGTC